MLLGWTRWLWSCIQASHADVKERSHMTKAKAKAKAAVAHGEMEPSRYDELKRILEDRRRAILAEVKTKIRDVRADGSGDNIDRVADAAETSEADIQDDIEFALIQMKAETLQKIDQALARLEEGAFGRCFECGEEISEQRLRALPFAVRCKDCEEAREVAAQRERVLSQRRAPGSLFLDLSS